MKKGLTLIELMITVVMFAILAAVIVYVFQAVLLSWSSAETRGGIDISLDRGIEEMVRDLRGATNVTDSVNNDEIRFTTGGSDYIYYLYHGNDSYPPSFSQTSYELRKATLTGGITGSLTDSGRVIITDVVPPATSDLSVGGNMITIDLSITRGDETIRSKTKVKPRNL